LSARALSIAEATNNASRREGGARKIKSGGFISTV